LTDQKITFASTNSYSQALYELGNEAGSLSEIEDQAIAILKLVRENIEVKNFIKNPINKIEQQAAAFDLISEKLNLNKLLKTFLNFIITKRRLFFIEKIIDDFIDTCSKNRGEIIADLLSSKELNETEILKIKDELATNFGVDIKLNYKYDPSLIGGLIIKVESIMIDTSIKSKLKQIETKMIEA
jgi:F-type H+-transporting ATPase subunit delta|tara:strand:- start:189 stop:743 length:555 start_codon:yes stop_codon:yes gene_type:complete